MAGQKNKNSSINQVNKNRPMKQQSQSMRKDKGFYNKNTTYQQNHTDSGRKKTVQRKEKESGWYLLPLIFAMAVLPFIVRFKAFNPHLNQYAWFPDITEEDDCFLYYKMCLLTITLLIMILIILYRFYKKRYVLQFVGIFIPLSIYALLALLSAIFSGNRILSFFGSRDQFEPIFAVLGYCVLVYYAYQFVKTEEDIQRLMLCLVISAVVMSVIGFSQYIGHDISGSKPALFLMTGSRNSSIQFNFPKGMVYLTLYNPNYVGTYAALILPILLVLLLFSKKSLNSILYIVAMIGLVISLIGSHSLTGLMGIGVAVIALLIFMWRYLLKRFYIAVPVLIVLLSAFFIVNKQTDNLMLQRIQGMTHLEKTEKNLTGINTCDDHIEIDYKKNTMNISFAVENEATGTFTILDKEGKNITSVYDEATSSILIQDDRFPGFSIIPTMFGGTISFDVKIDDKDWIFTNQTGDGKYYYYNSVGKLDRIKTAESAVFTGYENIASGRGFIWSRTLPLLKRHIFLGSGSNTFITAFPQDDYVDIYNYLGEGSYLTKPHNMYLQIAVETGLFSLIAFLVFYMIYFVSSIKLYMKGRFNSYYAQAGLAIFIGTIGYMFTGLANDSSITTAPVFWVLIGIGIVANYKAKPFILEERAA